MHPTSIRNGSLCARRTALVGVLLLAAACGDDLGSTPTPLPPTANPPAEAVPPAPVATVSFEEAFLLLSPSESRQAVPILRTAVGDVVLRPIAWQSSDESVATVSETGVVTARGDGVATISATTESARGEMRVTVEAPKGVPALATISPAVVTAYTSDFTLTLKGSGFSRRAWVRIGGGVLIPEFVSETELRVRVGANFLVQAGDLAIRVTNPVIGGGTSDTINLTVLPHPDTRPAPVLAALSRDTVYVGSGAQTLTITGSNFFPGAKAIVSGWDRPTTYVDSETLQVLLSVEDVARQRNHYVNVVNPGPGSGHSGALLLHVRSAPGS